MICASPSRSATSQVRDEIAAAEARVREDHADIVAALKAAAELEVMTNNPLCGDLRYQ